MLTLLRIIYYFHSLFFQGRIAYRLGRAANAADAESVLSTFMNYLTEIGHTPPKSKPAGQDRFYVACGYRKVSRNLKKKFLLFFELFNFELFILSCLF